MTTIARMSGRPGISVEEALAARAARSRRRRRPSRVPVPEAAGRVLAEDVRAGRDLPAADSSAMDGWAVRAADTPGVLRVAGESAAGLSGRASRSAPGAGDRDLDRRHACPRAPTRWRAARSCASEAATPSRVTEAVAAGPRRAPPRRDDPRRATLLLGAGHRVAPHEVGALGAMGRADGALRAAGRASRSSRPGPSWSPLGAPREPAAGPRLQPPRARRPGRGGRRRWWSPRPTVGDDLEATVAALAGAARRAGRRPAGRRRDQRGHLGGRPRPRAPGARAPRGGGGARAACARRRCTPTYLGRRGDQIVLGLPGNPASAAVAFHLLGRPLLGAAGATGGAGRR